MQLRNGSRSFLTWFHIIYNLSHVVTTQPNRWPIAAQLVSGTVSSENKGQCDWSLHWLSLRDEALQTKQ